MSLSSQVKIIHEQHDFVISSVPTSYGAGAATIFTITGGLVWIKAIVEYLDTAMTAATSSTIAVCGAAADGGAALIGAAAAGFAVVSPMWVTPKTVPNNMQSIPHVVAAGTQHGSGLIGVPAAGLNAIIVTFGGAAMAAADTWSLHVVYQKLSPASLIS